jgi:hypothetical protein
MSTERRLALLERCEKVRRRIPTVEHALINSVACEGQEVSWTVDLSSVYAPTPTPQPKPTPHQHLPPPEKNSCGTKTRDR